MLIKNKGCEKMGGQLGVSTLNLNFAVRKSCPHCGSLNICKNKGERMRWNGAGVKPLAYRCDKCKKRFSVPLILESREQKIPA
jgi:transposase-like protein